jgi:hypothetical protein
MSLCSRNCEGKVIVIRDGQMFGFKSEYVICLKGAHRTTGVSPYLIHNLRPIYPFERVSDANYRKCKKKKKVL